MIKVEYSKSDIYVNELILEIVECPRCKELLLFNNIDYKKCSYCLENLPPVRFMLETVVPRITYYNSNKQKPGVIYE